MIKIPVKKNFYVYLQYLLKQIILLSYLFIRRIFINNKERKFDFIFQGR